MTRILITGSNSGFGKLAALSLARLGHDVIATMRTPAKGDDLRATAEAENLPVEIRRLDVSDPASVVEAVGDPTAIDVVVKGEGEATVTELAALLAAGRPIVLVFSTPITILSPPLLDPKGGPLDFEVALVFDGPDCGRTASSSGTSGIGRTGDLCRLLRTRSVHGVRT